MKKSIHKNTKKSHIHKVSRNKFKSFKKHRTKRKKGKKVLGKL